MRTFELLTIVVMTAEPTGTSMCLYHSGSFFFIYYGGIIIIFLQNGH